LPGPNISADRHATSAATPTTEKEPHRLPRPSNHRVVSGFHYAPANSDLEFLLGYLEPSVFIEFMRHQKHPATKNGRLISAIQGSMQQRRETADNSLAM
jgi:hypothetical protein